MLLVRKSIALRLESNIRGSSKSEAGYQAPKKGFSSDFILGLRMIENEDFYLN